MVALIAAAPTFVWFVQPTKNMRVVVVDKTVPHPNYREHESMFWVLNHSHTIAPNGEFPWVMNRDYIGYYPERRDESGRAYGIRLQPHHLAQADVLQVADTYGVYTDDYDQPGTFATHLDYSELIHGGFDSDEVMAIEDFASRGGNIVAEFNTFASPTGGWAQRRLQELLGLSWNGWSGRYFEDLAEKKEVPVWARRHWREHYGTEWDFTGPGWLITNEDTRLFVLLPGRDVQEGGFQLVEVHQDDFLMEGCRPGIYFNFWFDIIDILPDSEVLASYRFDLTPEGYALMSKFGVPASFPAVVRASRDPLRVYFAGDVSDYELENTSFRRLFAPSLFAFHERILDRMEQRAFFWNFYVPYMMNVEDYLNDLGPVPDATQASP